MVELGIICFYNKTSGHAAKHTDVLYVSDLKVFDDRCIENSALWIKQVCTFSYSQFGTSSRRPGIINAMGLLTTTGVRCYPKFWRPLLHYFVHPRNPVSQATAVCRDNTLVAGETCQNVSKTPLPLNSHCLPLMVIFRLPGKTPR